MRCLGLAYMPWPTFVGCGSHDVSIFKDSTLLFWFSQCIQYCWCFHCSLLVLPKRGERVSPVLPSWYILVENGGPQPGGRRDFSGRMIVETVSPLPIGDGEWSSEYLLFCDMIPYRCVHSIPPLPSSAFLLC